MAVQLRGQRDQQDSQLPNPGIFGGTSTELGSRGRDFQLPRDRDSLYFDSITGGTGRYCPERKGPYDRALHVADVVKYMSSQQQFGKTTDRLGSMMAKEDDPRAALVTALGIAIAGKEGFGDGLAALTKLQEGVGAANRNFEKNSDWKEGIDGPKADAVLKYESKLGELVANYGSLDVAKLRAEVERMLLELK